MNIRHKLTLLLSVLFFFSVGNSILIFVLESYGETKNAWVVHTHEVLEETKKLLSSMTDSETGQRGYLLTGNPEYLEPYYHGLRISNTCFDNLSRRSADNPEQKKHLDKIRVSMKKKFDELKITIDLRKTGNPENIMAALDIVKNNSGKNYMDAIRIAITAFENNTRIQLEKRKGDFRQSRAQITTMIAIEIVFFIFMWLFTVFFIKDKLFLPIEMLLKNTLKMEKGEKQNIEDILPKDEMGYLLSSFYNMSEKIYNKTKKLTYESTHDTLTGLNNRVEIDRVISNSIVCLAGNNKKMAIYFIDLNKFKQLNDTFGHDAGDAVLEETANRLKEAVCSNDMVFRLGGDEFVIVTKNIDQISQAEILATNISAKFESPFIFHGDPIKISLSIGIAISPDDSTNSEEILKFSDVAMYSAKRKEGTNYRFFDKAMLKRKSDK